MRKTASGGEGEWVFCGCEVWHVLAVDNRLPRTYTGCWTMAGYLSLQNTGHRSVPPTEWGEG